MAQIMIQIMEKLLETEDTDEALAGSLELLVSATESLAGALWVRDEESGRYYPMFFMGEADLTNHSIQSGEYIEGKTAADGQTRTVAGTEGETDGSVFETTGISVRNIICVPLKNAGRTIGSMTVANKKENQAYSGEELRLCEQMAALITLTMEDRGYSLEKVRKGKPVLIEVRKLCKDYLSG